MVWLTARRDFTFKGTPYRKGDVIKVPAIVAVQLRALNAVEFAKRPAAPPKRPRRKPTQPQAQALPVTIAVEAPPADEPSPEPPAPEPPAPVVDDEALDDSTYRD